MTVLPSHPPRILDHWASRFIKESKPGGGQRQRRCSEIHCGDNNALLFALLLTQCITNANRKFWHPKQARRCYSQTRASVTWLNLFEPSGKPSVKSNVRKAFIVTLIFIIIFSIGVDILGSCNYHLLLLCGDVHFHPGPAISVKNGLKMDFVQLPGIHIPYVMD